jgi:methyl-accepting chemotaxis protein
MEAVLDPTAAGPRKGEVAGGAQQVGVTAARLRKQSERLRARLARSAEAVAAVAEHSAAIHDAMAQRGGLIGDARERAERARRFAAVERAAARAYRAGSLPPDGAGEAIRNPR